MKALKEWNVRQVKVDEKIEAKGHSRAELRNRSGIIWWGRRGLDKKRQINIFTLNWITV